MQQDNELHTMGRDELQREYLRGRLQEAEGRALKNRARAEIDRRFPRPIKPAASKGASGPAGPGKK